MRVWYSTSTSAATCAATRAAAPALVSAWLRPGAARWRRTVGYVHVRRHLCRHPHRRTRPRLSTRA
eukprot:1182859-Prorocentrum_minimum.AAC.7